MLAFRQSIDLRPTREDIMKTLLSLTMVLAFFVAVPQCLGQDADQSPAQLLTEQQLVQMFHLAMVQANTVEICHMTAGADPAEGDGFMITIPLGAVAGHCRHGDCTDFYLTTNQINCVCGGFQIDLCNN